MASFSACARAGDGEVHHGKQTDSYSGERGGILHGGLAQTLGNKHFSLEARRLRVNYLPEITFAFVERKPPHKKISLRVESLQQRSNF